MYPLRIADIAEAVVGQIVHCDPETVVPGPVEFDSRQVREGAVFLALPGARVDGHDFAATAHAQGAALVLELRDTGVPGVVLQRRESSDSTADAFVGDDGSVATLLGGLADLARLSITRLQEETDVVVIGVTGSAGKTSTKDLIAAIVEELGPTIAPRGSFNNEIGHPITVLRATEDTRHVVLELSARGVGHIAHLAAIAPPQIGVVLNVGSAHVGEFGSQEIIAQAKGELIEALPPTGLALLNADDPLVAAMAPRSGARTVRFFGEAETADIRATAISLTPAGTARFTVHAAGDSALVELAVAGRHQVSNALAAIAVGLACGATLQQCAAVLARTGARSPHRMDVRRRADGVTIVDDAYNANPESMRACIQAAIALADGHPDRVTLVLGPMGELGESSPADHTALGDYLAMAGVGSVIIYSPDAHPDATSLAAAARAGGVTTKTAAHHEEATRLAERMIAARGPQSVVAVKASYAFSLWSVADALTTPVTAEA